MSFLCLVWHLCMLLMCFKESRRLFSLCCYVLVHYRRSKCNYQKCSSIFDTYFNRKFTSDCSVQHIWNCPRECQPQHLKRLFFLKNRLINFHINSTRIIRSAKQNELSFSSIKIVKALSFQSTVSCRSDSSSEANSSCFHRSDAWSHLE